MDTTPPPSLLEQHPVVASVKDKDGLDAVMRSDCRIVFPLHAPLHGTLLDLPTTVQLPPPLPADVYQDVCGTTPTRSTGGRTTSSTESRTPDRGGGRRASRRNTRPHRWPARAGITRCSDPDLGAPSGITPAAVSTGHDHALRPLRP
ncbi:hypothetical protein ACH4MM_30810 [Streptomyces pratensis]|uniref:hypothetical protein n=1 Tax=Streptomyces pratensis TaxID=1169025 RepID=UPI0037A3CC5A